MKISYLAVSGALSQMVEVRGACGRSFLDIIIAMESIAPSPHREGDDVVTFGRAASLHLLYIHKLP